MYAAGQPWLLGNPNPTSLTCVFALTAFCPQSVLTARAARSALLAVSFSFLPWPSAVCVRFHDGLHGAASNCPSSRALFFFSFFLSWSSLILVARQYFPLVAHSPTHYCRRPGLACLRPQKYVVTILHPGAMQQAGKKTQSAASVRILSSPESR